MKTISTLLCLVLASVHAVSDLAPGDIAITSLAFDDPDAFSFVTWVDIDEGTVLFFTDDGWGCDAFRGFESVIQWTAPVGGVLAGSVHAFSDDAVAMPWSVVRGSTTFSTLGDQIIVYQGSEESPSFVYAVDTTAADDDSSGWEACEDVSDSLESAIPTGLEDGVTAVSFKHYDNLWYRPWYARSAVLATLKEWMTMRSRFISTSLSDRRVNEYEVPPSFRILEGERGSNGMTEYIPGTAPCIFTSGHDGELFPSDIDDRTHGCLVDGECVWTKGCAPADDSACRAVTANDENTQDMARRAADYFEAATGQRCHLVVNRLGRIKLDPNREQDEAVQLPVNAVALQTYNDFHAYVTTASGEVSGSTCGAGLVFDFHGHTHPEGRIELGYKLTADNLREDDATIDTLAYTSSAKHLETQSGLPFSDIINGAGSLGALFNHPTAGNASGYLSVPSDDLRAPSVGESYFQGGYIVETHGSQDGGTVDGIQAEFPRWLRADNWESQDDMLSSFGSYVLPTFLETLYGFTGGVCPPPPPSSRFETITVADVGSDGWTEVVMTSEFSDPVVVCSPVYTGTPASVRTSGVTPSGFKVRLSLGQAAASSDTTTVYCLAVNAGSSSDPLMEAGHFSASMTPQRRSSWGGSKFSLSASNSYSNPVVFGQLESGEGESEFSPFRTFWASGTSNKNPPVSDNIVLSRHQAESSENVISDDVGHYIVFESNGSLDLDGVPGVVKLSSDSIRGATNSVSNQRVEDADIPDGANFAIVGSAGMDGGDGGWAVLRDPFTVGADKLGVVISEDTFRDNEVSHTTEQVSYLVLAV